MSNNTSNTDRVYAFAIANFPKISHRLANSLFRYFGSWEQVWTASSAELERTRGGSRQDTIDSFVKYRQETDPISIWKKFSEEERFDFLLASDDDFPASLLDISDPPQWLHIWGELKKTDVHGISVVGPRYPSSYGRQITEQIVGDLADMGITIVSGMALGIDALAHYTALDHSGRTVAIIGSGLLDIYPKSNIKLANKIVDSGGAIISEFPLDASPEPWRFPIRNRLVAGLGQGVLVSEAGEKSGSLITASIALEQGKEVWAVPGNVFAPTSVGVNNIIKRGEAKSISSSQDILDSFGLVVEGRNIDNIYTPKTDIEIAIWEALSWEPQSTDDIARASGEDISIVSSTLMIWQMQKYIKNIENNKWTR